MTHEPSQLDQIRLKATLELDTTFQRWLLLLLESSHCVHSAQMCSTEDAAVIRQSLEAALRAFSKLRPMIAEQQLVKEWVLQVSTAMRTHCLDRPCLMELAERIVLSAPCED